jgi:hypothetical protein
VSPHKHVGSFLHPIYLLKPTFLSGSAPLEVPHGAALHNYILKDPSARRWAHFLEHTLNTSCPSDDEPRKKPIRKPTMSVNDTTCSPTGTCYILNGAFTNGTYFDAQFDPNFPVPIWRPRLELAFICFFNSMSCKTDFHMSSFPISLQFLRCFLYRLSQGEIYQLTRRQ